MSNKLFLKFEVEVWPGGGGGVTFRKDFNNLCAVMEYTSCESIMLEENLAWDINSTILISVGFVFDINELQ